MRIAIYSRKSKFTGKGESIENQIGMCRDYIFNRIEGVKQEDIFIYEDEGFSAKDLNRPQFKKMLQDSHKQKYDYIVCYRLDRISRSVSDFSNLIEDLNRREISFICIREQFDTSTPMGRAMMYIASVFAQLERETLAERVRDNMIMLSRSGRWLGGMTPTGFDSEKIEEVFLDGKQKTSCKLKFNDEITTVKLIFQKYLELYSISGVSKYLIKNSIKSRTNCYFSNQGIHDILINPVYCVADETAYQYFIEKGSDVCFEKNKCNNISGLIGYRKRDYKVARGKMLDVSEWIIAIGRHKGLISGREWVAVQKRLEDNIPKKKAIKAHNDYALLSGVIRCKKCGSRMFTKSRNSKRNETDDFDYICNSKLRAGSMLCDCQNLNGKMTDALVCEFLTTFMEEDSRILLLLESLKRKYLNDNSVLPKINLETRITQIEKEIENLLDSLSDIKTSKGLVKRVDKRIGELEKELQMCQNEQNRLKDVTELNDQSQDGINTIVKKLTHFRDCFTTLTIQEKRELIKELIEKIEWDEKDLNIFIYDEL